MFWSNVGIDRWLPDRLLAINSLSLVSTLPVLQDATFFCSLGWILYRIWQIYQKPVDELVELLGLDIPPVPDVSLGGISSDSVLLYWKPVESQSTSLKNAIQVNGIKVGEINLKDDSIQVTGLRPGHYYNIRVITTNSAGFSTLGALIHLRTVPGANKGGTQSTNSLDDDGNDQIEDSEPASVRPIPSQLSSTVHALPYQPAKDVFSTLPSNRRSIFGRRASPATSFAETSSLLSSRAASVDEEDSDESIKRLTEQLDRLRREQYETDKQIEDEDREHLTTIADLSRDRDHLKQMLKEKEESTAELRKHNGHLEKTNRSAQSKKAMKERILQQKKVERQKIRDDVDQWDRDVASMRQESERMVLEKEQMTVTKDEDVAEIRKQISREQGDIKTLEDEIRTRGIHIKSMEKTRENTEENEEDEHDGAHNGTGDGQAWEFKAHSIQLQLANLWQTLQQAELENHQAQERVAYWTSRRSRDPGHFAALPASDYVFLNRNVRPQQHRQLGSRSNAVAVPFGGFQSGPPGIPYNPSSASPHFSSASPFFNMSNGMAVPEMQASSTSGHFNPSLNDSETLTGGSMMSPAATDLLPSNLFRDEDSILQDSPTALRHESSGGGSSERADSQSIPPVENPDTERLTPASGDSRRGSLLSSPHGSLRNHHSGHSTGDVFPDGDRVSMNSTSASVLPNASPNSNVLGTSRLAHFFPTFNRQRGKSSAHEPPALGTLKQGQSQSFPRNIEQDSFDAMERRRRRGSYGNWALPMTGLLNRHGIGTEEAPKDPSISNTFDAAAPRNRMNVFGTRRETDGVIGFHERTSSRPSSMYSFEQIRGRPSSDSQRLGGWPVTESTPSRSSPLNTNWSASGGPWSRAPSRRPSVQHGSTSNLSIGSTPLDLDTYDSILAPQRSEQLPIGTRPRSAQRFTPPKLNPAAPTFKTIFGRSEARKAARAEKANGKTIEKSETAHAEETTSAGEDSSLSQPRLSRDAGSITTAGSVAESSDSLDHSMSGTASEAAGSSATRESFMQKITRKSSSSKFNVPWGKERGGLFSKKAGEASTADEGGEDRPIEGQVPKSGDGVTTTPQQDKASRSSLSWPNMRRKSRKGGLSIEKGSETAEDDDI